MISYFLATLIVIVGIKLRIYICFLVIYKINISWLDVQAHIKTTNHQGAAYIRSQAASERLKKKGYYLSGPGIFTQALDHK